MATVNFTKTEANGVTRVTWVLGNNDDGVPVNLPNAPDKSVQVFGTPDGGTTTMQGSNEETVANYATLHDPAGNNCAFTANGIKAVAENCQHIRPVMTGATAGSMTVVLLARSAR